MIWTTTPWTLPANVAIAAHPDLDYAGIRYTDPTSGEAVHTILAAELVAKVMGLRGVTDFKDRPVQGKAPSNTRGIGTSSSTARARSSSRPM